MTTTVLAGDLHTAAVSIRSALHSALDVVPVRRPPAQNAQVHSQCLHELQAARRAPQTYAGAAEVAWRSGDTGC